MNELLKIILSLSLSGALLILILLLCKPLVKDKLSKRWQYYIWLVVVARLLLPFASETNLVGTLFQYFDQAMVQTDIGIRPEQQSPVLSETDYSDQGNVPGQVGLGDVEQPGVVKLTTPGIFDMVKQNVAAVSLLVWLIVAACLLIRKVTIYQSFVKYIQAGRTEIADIQLWEHVGKLVEQTDVKGAVGLYTNSLISSPLLIGFFRPCIMLPTTELSESDFENTILHELTHYKRRDMFYKWLVQVTICFHWFNPLVYLMGREINRACELSCDEAVIKSMDAKKQRAYGDTLLNAMDAGGSYKNSIASVSLNEGKEFLKERLDAIMKFKKTTRLTAAISVILIFVLCFGATAVGAYAATPSVTTKGDDVNLTEHNDIISPETLDTKPEVVPLRIDDCEILYDDSKYRWPNNVISFTNTSDKSIMDYEIVCLAYDKNGTPLALYWDAQNVAANGEVGNVGFSPDGIDYGIVTSISPVSPKAYSHIYRRMQQQPPENLIRSLEIENGKAWVENWLKEWKQSEKEIARENAVAPGQSQQASWLLFDGWDQSMGKHDAIYIVACIKQVTYGDGAIWVNPAYGEWLEEFQGRSVSTSVLENYYD